MEFEEDRFLRLYTSAQEYCTRAEHLLERYPQGNPLDREHVERRLRAFITLFIGLQDPHVPRLNILAVLDLLVDLVRRLSNLAPVDEAPVIPVIRNGRPGRPKKDLPLPVILDLHQKGSTWEDIAEVFGVHRTTLHRHFKDADVQTFEPYSDIEDEALDHIVDTYFGNHPDDGQQLLMGHLRSLGHKIPRDRLRASVHRVDVRALREL